MLVMFGYVSLLLVCLRLVRFAAFRCFVSTCSDRLSLVLFMFGWFWLGLTTFCYVWLLLVTFG